MQRIKSGSTALLMSVFLSFVLTVGWISPAQAWDGDPWWTCSSSFISSSKSIYAPSGQYLGKIYTYYCYNQRAVYGRIVNQAGYGTAHYTTLALTRNNPWGIQTAASGKYGSITNRLDYTRYGSCFTATGSINTSTGNGAASTKVCIY